MRLAWFIAVSSSLSACSLVLPSADEFSGGGAKKGGSGGGTGCPVTAGPPMVLVGEYCIDTSEVTATDYAAFLQAGISPSSGGDPFCVTNNTSYQPGVWPNGSIDDRPVVWVDWCDARDYCVWAGKRLCAGIGGANVAYESPLDASVHEWFNVCTNAGTTPLPYGAAPINGVCNTNASALELVKAKPACHGEGKFAEVFDMVGNAREWVGVCSGADWCQALGSAFDNSGQTCSDEAQKPKMTSDVSVGFRCCGDAVP